MLPYGHTHFSEVKVTSHPLMIFWITWSNEVFIQKDLKILKIKFQKLIWELKGFVPESFLILWSIQFFRGPNFPFLLKALVTSSPVNKDGSTVRYIQNLRITYHAPLIVPYQRTVLQFNFWSLPYLGTVRFLLFFFCVPYVQSVWLNNDALMTHSTYLDVFLFISDSHYTER